MAVWGDLKAETSIQESFENAIKTKNSKLNRIWTNFPNKTHQIIKKSFKKVYNSAVKTILNINKETNKEIKEFRNSVSLDIFKSAKFDSQTSLNRINSEDEENNENQDFDLASVKSTENNMIVQRELYEETERKIESELASIEYRKWFKIGCTVNFSGNKLLSQGYMLCETCKKKNNIEVKVCIPCSYFWHAGHTLIRITKSYSKVVWSCGTHSFTNLDLNSAKNPLYKILNGKLEWNKWSLLKKYWKFKEIRRLMYKDKNKSDDEEENK